MDIKVLVTRKIEDSLFSRIFEHSSPGAHFSLHLKTFDPVVREKERKDSDDNVFFFRAGPHFFTEVNTHVLLLIVDIKV